jgi:hypothetical protein
VGSRWPALGVGALIAAAALLGAALLARPFWPGRPAPVDGPSIGQQAPGEEEDNEPFPVASGADIHVISVDPQDADALVTTGPPILGRFEWAAPHDHIEVLAASPAQANGPMPHLQRGTVPMILLSDAREEP